MTSTRCSEIAFQHFATVTTCARSSQISIKHSRRATVTQPDLRDNTCKMAMDSGNGHLAANYDIPVITLWGVTHPYAGFVPFGQPMEHQIVSDRKQYPLIPTSIYGNKFPEGYENVMRSIEPNTIVQKVERVLS